MEKIILPVIIGLSLYFGLGLSLSCNEQEKTNLLKTEKLSTTSNQLGGENEIIGWIENSRYNINYDKYPPCFEISYEAQQIFDIFEEKNLILTYKVIFEIMSMILCQYNFLESKICTNTMINDRIRELEAFGYRRYDNRYRNKLKRIIGTYYLSSTQSSLEFLLRSLTLIEINLGKLKKNDFNKNELRQVISLMNKFYEKYFITIAKDC